MKMKRIAYEDYPDVLNAEQIAMLLGISRSGAYQLLNRADFPTLQNRAVNRKTVGGNFARKCTFSSRNRKRRKGALLKKHSIGR